MYSTCEVYVASYMHIYRASILILRYEMSCVSISSHSSVIQGHGKEDWIITFNPPEITAVPGLCALISCTFTYPNEANPIDNVQWGVCNKNGGQCKNMRSIFEGKVSTQHKNTIEEKETETERIKMLEPDLTKNNCSIIMKDIKAEDEKIYAFRVEGPTPHKMTYTPTVKVIIQGNACLCLVKFKRSRLFL